MMVTFDSQGPIDIVVLSFENGFLVKVPPMLRILNSTKIGCLTLSLKYEIVVDLHCLHQLGME